MTPAELTVLGLLVERPRHGYDLEQVIEQRGVRRWTDIGFSSIYYLLGKLEKRGLVVAVQDRPAATSRRVFRVTAEGERVTAAETARFIAEAEPVPQPALVGLANQTLLPEQDYAAALRTRLAGIEARLASVRAAEQAQAPLPRPAREVFSYSVSLLEAERSWLAARVEAQDG
nr:PadR family transcriptional regulator [Auraticoccus cholistanensis]